MSEQDSIPARSNGKTQSFARGLLIGLICYWAILFVATHVPTAPPQVIDHFDKVLHFSAFCVLAVLLGTFTSFSFGYDFSKFLGIWIVIVAYGVADEYTQRFVRGRSTDPYDLLADACGAACGLLAVRFYFARRFTSRNSESADGNLPS